MIRTGIAALLLRLLIAGNDKNNLERFPASCQCVRYGTINQRIFIGSPHESRFVPSCCCLFSSNGSVLKVVLCVHSTRSSAVIQHYQVPGKRQGSRIWLKLMFASCNRYTVSCTRCKVPLRDVPGGVAEELPGD